MNTEYHFPIRSSTATGFDVKTARDESVGSIKDLMIDTETGEIAYVVLAVDEGFLNLGKKYLALPWAAFNFNTKENNLAIVNVNKEKLEKAPGFDKDAWPIGPQNQFIDEVNTYFGFERRRAIIE